MLGDDGLTLGDDGLTLGDDGLTLLLDATNGRDRLSSQ